MKLPFRARIAVRSTVLIILATLLVSVPLQLAITAKYRRQEVLEQYATLDQLLDTVERTTQAACFLEDVQLAEELQAGLLKNEIVGRVSIRAGSRILADQARPGWRPNGDEPITRAIHSPFDPGLVVGKVLLFPNQGEIARLTAKQARVIALILALQALAVALASVGATLLLVTRPIAKVSRQLNHLLRVETDAYLSKVPGHEQDEIGRMVGDVNALVERLHVFIHAARYQRDEAEDDKLQLQAALDALERSLAEVKTLQGLLPICAWCKKIRDDEGLWTGVEHYLASRAEVQFTHGLCPECARREFGADGAVPMDEPPV